MLGWAITFLLAALAAAWLGYGGSSDTAAGIARLFCFVFTTLFCLTLLGSMIGRKYSR